MQTRMFEDELLIAPEPGMVLKIKDWEQEFETSRSRDIRRMNKVMVPNDMNSTGCMKMQRQFEDKQVRRNLMFVFETLCKIAGRKDKGKRGYLCGDSGEAWDAWMITHQESSWLELELVEFCIRYFLSLGWLEWAWPFGVIPETAQNHKRPEESAAKPAAEPVAKPDSATPLPERCHDVATPLPQRCHDVATSGRIEAVKPNQTKPKELNPNQTNACGAGGDGWNAVQQQLQQLGVTAARKAAQTAQRAGWSVDLASGVLQHFREHPTAYTAFQLYERFQASASVSAADGWPAAAAEFQERRRRQRAEEIAAAEQAARDRERAAKRDQLAAEKRAGPITDFAEQARKLAERKAVNT